MQDPLKQGLKHKLPIANINTPISISARSIKTRIETTGDSNDF